MKKTFLALLFAIQVLATTVTITTPQPGDNVGKIWQMTGTATATTGMISSMSYTIDGGSCGGGFTGCSGAVSQPGTSWLGTLYAIAGSIPSGTHTLVVSATDSMGNTGSSASTSITIVYSNPICSMTAIGTAYTCVEAGSQSSTTASTIGVPFTGGYNKGDVLYAFSAGLVGGSPNSNLAADITTTTATTFTIVQPTVYSATATSASGNIIVLTAPTTPTDVCAFRKGQTITGTGIPSDTRVMGCGIDSEHLVLSHNPTISGSTAVSLAYVFPATPFTLTITDDVIGDHYEPVTVTTLNAPSGGMQTGVMIRGASPQIHLMSNGNQPVGWYSPGPFPYDCSTMMSNTLGYTWNLLQTVGSSFTDEGTVQTATCYAIVPTTTGASDTITSAFPAAVNNELILDVVVYRGLGAVGTKNTPFAGWAGAGFASNAAMTSSGSGGGGILNSWTGVTPGDLCIALAGGSPFQVVNSGGTLIPSSPPVAPSASAAWIERTEDYLRPFSMVIDAVATGTSCNGGTFVTPGDGVSAMGTAFHPTVVPQSVSLTTGTVSASVPAQTAGLPWRVAFSLQNWATTGWTGTISPIDAAPVGANISLIMVSPGDIRLQIYSQTTTGGQICAIAGLGPNGLNGGSSIYTNLFLKVEFDEYPTSASGPFDSCRAWDINGNLVSTEAELAMPYLTNTGSNFGGVSVTGLGSGNTLQIGYFRIYTATQPSVSRPPINVDSFTNCLVAWEFEGNLNDSCTSYSGTPSGTIAYANTLGASLVMPVIYSLPYATIPQADWWLPLQPGQGLTWDTSGLNAAASPFIDLTQSYSDSASSVTCSTVKNSGPAGTITSPSSLTSTVTGVAAGDFNITATCTDGINSGSSTADIGAVSINANGQVVTGNQDIDFFFGQLVAFGKNNWGFQDYWALHASDLRATDYTSQLPSGTGTPWITGSSNQPQWEYEGSGTIAWYLNCIGGIYFCNGGYSGTVSGSSVTTGATSITISTVGGSPALDLSTIPTHIILYDGSKSAEVSVCSGSTTLTVCYDGWGNQSGGTYASVSQTFAPGTLVLQAKIVGTSTHFLTDSNAAICPLGTGPPGLSLYSTGTLALTQGSATVTGSGTTWTSAMIGAYLRVASTHSSTAFTFIAQIASVASATSLTLTRIYPSTADTLSSLTYNIMLAERTVDLRYPHVVDATGVAEQMWGTSDCTSETEAYLNPFGAYNTFASSHDLSTPFGTSLDGNHITTSSCTGCGKYGITDTTGWINEGADGGISFYSESIAHRALAIRSGLTAPLTASLEVVDWWMKSPWGNGDGNGYPRLYLGGEGIGTIAHAVIDSVPSLWPDIRSYANLGIIMACGQASVSAGGCASFYPSTPPLGCNANDDTRDTGYAYSWLILSSIYDPDTTSTASPAGGSWRSYWQSFLPLMYANDTACQNQTASSQNSFANATYFNGITAQTGIPPITMTNNSAAVTGTGIPSGICNGTASGTATVTNGSNIITITGSVVVPTGTRDLFLTGTSGGLPFIQSIAYGLATPTLLGAYWYGDTGAVTWVSGAWEGAPSQGEAQDALTIGTSNSDLTNMAKNWACTWNSSTSITLNRPWDGPSSAAGISISAATNTSPIVITVPNTALLLATLTISGATGNTNANGLWTVTVINSTTASLNGSTGNGAYTGGGTISYVYHPYIGNLAGYGTQPFTLGIKTLGENWLVTQTVSALSSYIAPYQTFLTNSTSWIWNIGMDHQLLATNYGRVFQQCEPANTAPVGTSFTFRAPGCTYGNDPVTVLLSRENNSETGAAHVLYFQANPTSPNRLLGDQFYGALWGFCPWTTPGFYCDTNATAASVTGSNLSDSSIHQGKWFAFFTGIGMSHRWPIARLAGAGPIFSPVSIFGRGILGNSPH